MCLKSEISLGRIYGSNRERSESRIDKNSDVVLELAEYMSKLPLVIPSRRMELPGSTSVRHERV